MPPVGGTAGGTGSGRGNGGGSALGSGAGEEKSSLPALSGSQKGRQRKGLCAQRSARACGGRTRYLLGNGGLTMIDNTDAPSRLTFAVWLDVVAPAYARLYLRKDSPLWNAIFDLRAAMIVDQVGDCSSDDWTHDDGVLHRAPATLASCGILLPRALFDRVWRIYRESPGAVWQEDGARSENDDAWARCRLLNAARYAIDHGWQRACRSRFACDPD